MADIVQKGPIVYLNVSGRWYYYDMRSTPLGAGAMGIVYLGYSMDGSRQVAIKKMHDKYANIPSIRERAKLEAKLMFRHDNLIEMVGCCELYSDRGPLYIISNFISGKNIDVFIRETWPKNTIDRANKICTLFYPVLDALSYIHSYNIVHMDIKPSNIIVENGRNVRLMDLGIAHVEDNGYQVGKHELVGTPKYAAPEQFGVGANTKLNAQTDIYEAGVSLYELLCGYNPFSADTLEGSIGKHNVITLPYTDNIPRKLVDVLRVATRHNQSERYKSAAEFKNAIKTALIPDKSHKGLIWAVVGVLFFVITLIVLVYGYSHR